MNQPVGPRILAIGAPPTFRQDVARCMDASPETVDWLPSVTAAEEFVVVRHMEPDVMVLSPEIKDADALGVADFMAKHSPATAVILVRYTSPNGLLPMAMRAGVRDVVDLSRGEEDLADALSRASDWARGVRSHTAEPEHAGERGKIISIFSSKGGVGKTFLSCNLAAALADKGEGDTALLDLDLKVGDVFSYFGQEPTRPIQDLLSLAERKDPEALVATGKQLGDNLWAYGVTADPACESMPGETTGKIVRNLRANFAYTVIDASNDYSDQTVAVFDLSDEIWLVTGLDVVGMRHLLIGMDTLTSLGIPHDRFRVVLNRSDSKVGVSLTDVERVLRVQVDAKIPSSELVPQSLNKGKPVYLGEPGSEVARAITEIAETIIGTPQSETAPAAQQRRGLKLLLGLG
ncbi:MAG TPA: P-loop NTPase [Actinomycetota bacterium]|nr:P-loop NTPase [Actinomycetota bacterium]